MFVSKLFKGLVKESIPIINTKLNTSITTTSSFHDALKNILLNSLSYGYESLMAWYQEQPHIYLMRNTGKDLLLMHQAALSTHDDIKKVFKWLKNNGYDLPNDFNPFLWCSASKCGLSRLIWLDRKRGFTNEPEEEDREILSYSFSQTGDKSILHWLSGKIGTLSSSAWVGAAEKGHYHLFKWFNKKGVPFDILSISSAVEKGLVNVLDIFFDQRMILHDVNYEAFIYNDEKVNLQINLDNHFLIDYNSLYGLAFRTDQLEVIKWIYKKLSGARHPALRGHSICHLMPIAAKNGQMSILRWAHEQGELPCSGKSCSNGMCINRRMPDICNNIIFTKNLSDLKWLIEIGCGWDDFISKVAIQFDYFEFFKWTMKNNPSYDSVTISMCAVYYGRLNVLEWLNSTRDYWLDQEIYAQSLICRRYDIFEWAIKEKISPNNITWNIKFDEITLRYVLNENESEIFDNLLNDDKKSIINWITEHGYFNKH